MYNVGLLHYIPEIKLIKPFLVINTGNKLVNPKFIPQALAEANGM